MMLILTRSLILAALLVLAASRSPAQTITRPAVPLARAQIMPSVARRDHTAAGAVIGAVAGGVGFAVYTNARCQSHRSDAGCGASVTLAAIGGAAVGAFVGAIIGRRS